MISREEQLEYLKLLELKYRKSTEKYWAAGDLDFKLHAGQQEVMSKIKSLPKARESLIFCSRQWGKSFFGIIYALKFAIKNPYTLVRIAAPTLKQAQDIVADGLDIISKDAPEGMVKRAKSTYRWYVNGLSGIRLGVLEKAHVDSLRGTMAHLVICEEGGFVRSDDYEYAVRSVLTPQLLHTRGSLMHITTPSEDPDHYIHKEVLPRCQSTGTFFKYTIYTNPRLDKEQIDTQAQLLGGTESSAWRREALAEIVRDNNFVCVPEFNPELHVKDFKLPEHSHYMVAIDFGGVRDKTVGLLMTYDFLKGVILVYDERVFASNTSTTAIVNELLKMEFMFRVKDRIADAPGQVLVDLASKYSYDCLLPHKDSFEAGVNNVRLLINTGKLIIHSQCRFLSATLNGASFNKSRTDFNRTEFLGHMDALAALVYGCRMIDKTSNPYPMSAPNWHDNLYIKEKEPEGDIENLASIMFRRQSYTEDNY